VFSGSYMECCEISENGAKILKISRNFNMMRNPYAVGEYAARRRFGGTHGLARPCDSRPTPGVPAPFAAVQHDLTY
jgi:hypothetical protein